MIIDIVIALLLMASGAFYYMNYRNSKEQYNALSFKEGLDLTELPIVTFRHNGVKLNFILDTGSTSCLIDKRLLPYLSGTFCNETKSHCGIEGVRDSTVGYCMEIEHRGKTFSDTFYLKDMANVFDSIKIESGVKVHGLLGSSFFTNNKFVIDYKDFVAYAKR